MSVERVTAPTEIQEPWELDKLDPSLPITGAQAQALFSHLRQTLELIVGERISAALSRHDQLNYDLKQFHRTMDIWAKWISFYTPTLMEARKRFGGPDGVVETPRSGDWQLSAAMYRKPKKRRAQLPGPIPSWRKEAAEAADKLRRELPPLSTIADLAVRFGVSYNRIFSLVSKGQVRAQKEGKAYMIPRESVVAYVREHGTLQPQKRHYQ